MSQKNLTSILTKPIATFLALSFMLSNFSICGLGISKVIAEDTEVPSIEVEFENSKYVQYKTEEDTGVAIQSKVSIIPNQEEDKYLQTKNSELQITLPKLNECLPEKATVVLADTYATTGEGFNQNINQSYDKTTGLLKVLYENNNTTAFKENAKDEFEIIYIYPKEAYTGNSEEIKLNYNVNAKLTFVKDTNELVAQTSKNFEISAKENISDLTSFSVTELENKIYKGFMYSNVENNTNYETEYKTKSTLCILNSDILNELSFKTNENEFVINDNKDTISSNGNIVYRKTTIDRREFDKILGNDGYIDIYQGEDEIAMVSYDDNTSKLTIVYADGRDSQIIENDAKLIEITYETYLTSFNIITSKPITEGFIHFGNESVIKASNNYGQSVEEIKSIKVTSGIKETTSDTYLTLTEPTTKIGISLSNVNFSTLQAGTTKITVKLDDTNSSCKLFENPTINIKLPEGIESGNVSSPEIVNGNGLSINKTSIKQNVITIELTGKQTKYDTTNVSGGVSIVMDIDNIKYSELQPTHTDKVTLTCSQNGTATTDTNVNVISKEGLLVINRISGYDELGSSVGGFDFTEKNIEVPVNSTEKEITEDIILVNNNQEDLTNVQIMGSFTSADSTFNLTFANMTLASEDGAQVYFSENINAEFDDESWSKTATNDSKLYKIVYPGNIMPASTSLKLTFKLKVPAELEFNEKTIINNDLTYNYQNYTYNNETKKFVISTPTSEIGEKQNENSQQEENNPTSNEESSNKNNEKITLEIPLGDGENDDGIGGPSESDDNIEYVAIKPVEEISTEKDDNEPNPSGYVNPENVPYLAQIVSTQENPTQENPTQENPTQENPTQEETEKIKYSISGVAWLDSNKNGQRDENEKLQDSVIVSLIDTKTGNLVLNADGTKVTATTDSEGKYKFNNIAEGEYVVLFEFDNNSFTVTTYQKTGVTENVNSDAILSSVQIDNKEKILAITDNIKLNANAENIDLGLIENATFDLSLDKKITNITVVNSKGTESYDYKNGDSAKVDLVAKYMAGAEVIVTYKFTITNNGDTVGYVNSLVDNLPSGLEFSSELNTKWYKGNDGNLYMTALSETDLKPGESEEVELILTKTMTENNAGTFVNNAKLTKVSNLENISEKTDALEDNNSSAILIISIRTGSVILYTGITLACIAIIAVGTYIIKKKILLVGIDERRIK